jgi:hypothetical protein
MLNDEYLLRFYVLAVNVLVLGALIFPQFFSRHTDSYLLLPNHFRVIGFSALVALARVVIYIVFPIGDCTSVRAAAAEIVLSATEGFVRTSCAIFLVSRQSGRFALIRAGAIGVLISATQVLASVIQINTNMYTHKSTSELCVANKYWLMFDISNFSLYFFILLWHIYQIKAAGQQPGSLSVYLACLSG